MAGSLVGLFAFAGPATGTRLREVGRTGEFGPGCSTCVGTAAWCRG